MFTQHRSNLWPYPWRKIWPRFWRSNLRTARRLNFSTVMVLPCERFWSQKTKLESSIIGHDTHWRVFISPFLKKVFFCSSIGNGEPDPIPLPVPSNASGSSPLYNVSKWRAWSWCYHISSRSSSASIASDAWLSHWISTLFDRERTSAPGKPGRQCSRKRLSSEYEPTHCHGNTKWAKPLRYLRSRRHGWWGRLVLASKYTWRSRAFTTF